MRPNDFNDAISLTAYTFIVGWQIPQQVSKDWENTFRIWSGNGILEFDALIEFSLLSLFTRFESIYNN